MALVHDSAKGDHLMNVERGTINNNVFKQFYPSKRRHCQLRTLLCIQFTQRSYCNIQERRERDEKNFALLEDSSIENSTSHSALTNRKCDGNSFFQSS